MSNLQDTTAWLIEQNQLQNIKPVEDTNLETALQAAVDPVIERAAQELMPIQKTDEQLNADIDNLSAGISAVAVKNETADEPLVVEMIKENNKIDIHIGTSHIKNPG